jgi:hypothetical protein
MKIKDYYLGFLSESENYFHVDSESVGDVLDVDINKKEDYIKIDFETTYGKPTSIITNYSSFRQWYSNNINKFTDVFKAFITEFLANSKEEENEPVVNEIVDEEGNIMSSDDKPNNSTNSMIGSKNTWDLEKVYKSSMPRSVRYMNGSYGRGGIVW